MNWDCHVHVFGPAAQFPVSSARGYTPPLRTLAQVVGLAAAAGIAPLGWHIQFLIAPEDLRRVQALRKRTAVVPFVFDHFAGLTIAHGQDGEHAGVLRELMVRDDCWIKLSGFYRLTNDRAYRDLDPLLLELATVAPDRILWGSDWPHTWYFEAKRGSPPAYAATLAPLDRCLPPELRQKALQNNPWKLYL